MRELARRLTLAIFRIDQAYTANVINKSWGQVP